MNGNHRTSGRRYVILNYSQLYDAVSWLPLKFDSEGSTAEHRWHRKKEVVRDTSYSIGWSNFQALGVALFRCHVWMWELDHKESWVLKNWCFWTVVLEKTLESPLDCKEIQPVHSEGDQSWIFTGRTDAEAEAPVLCPPDAKSWLIRKDSDAGKE